MNKNPSLRTQGGQHTRGYSLLSDNAIQEMKRSATINAKRRTKDDWRSLFALIILGGFFIVIGSIVAAWLFGHDIDSVIKILSAVGALLGSPLGFVIGYYYKDKNK